MSGVEITRARACGFAGDIAVVCGYGLAQDRSMHGFFWRSDQKTVKPLPLLPDYEASTSVVKACSQDGSVIVGSVLKFDEAWAAVAWEEAAIWTAKDDSYEVHSLGNLPDSDGSLATCVSADGSTIAGSCWKGYRDGPDWHYGVIWHRDAEGKITTQNLQTLPDADRCTPFSVVKGSDGKVLVTGICTQGIEDICLWVKAFKWLDGDAKVVEIGRLQTLPGKNHDRKQ